MLTKKTFLYVAVQFGSIFLALFSPESDPAAGKQESCPAVKKNKMHYVEFYWTLSGLRRLYVAL